jgi:hypothetical protein
MLPITVLVALLALPYPLGGPPWEKPPEKWSITDVYRILQDSPWSPSDVKIEAKGAPRQEDARTGMPAPSPIDSPETNTVPGGQLGFSKPQASIPVIWWSSKTIRLAELRLRQLRDSAQSKDPLKVDDLPDFVLVIEGSEQLRILRDAKEDLHDTTYLEIPNQGTIDLATVEFIEGAGDQEPRVEFHFPRQMDGQPTLDPDLDRIIFHVKATAKTPRPFQDNTIALRAEFKPKNMRVRGVPDL